MSKWLTLLAPAILFSSYASAELNQYQSIMDIGKVPTSDISKFAPQTGIFILKRDDQGNPTHAKIRVLVNNQSAHVEVTGDFNNWGREEKLVLIPDEDPQYFVGMIPNLRHGMAYRLIVDGRSVLDPSSLAYSSDSALNSIFWDIEGKGRANSSVPLIDLRRSAVSITEIDVASLVQKWPNKNQLGPANRAGTYKFVSDSGVIQKLKQWGINAIEFLPTTASVDEEVWPARYLSYGLFAIDGRWGSPKEFAGMIDQFHQNGIAVILDAVIGHFPHSGNKGARDLSAIGPSVWRKGDGRPLFGEIPSPWNTTRYDFANPYVRRFITDSIINMIKYYHIDGIRIDNWGGIQGLPGGRQFLQDLNSEIKSYAPHVLINAEAFGGDNSLTRRIDEGGFGANFHNDGDFFFNFIAEDAKKRTEELDMAKIRGLLRDPWGWNEMATLRLITNHDEASNDTGKANGAYFATVLTGGEWKYIEGKVRAFASLAMLSGSYYLDMPQLRLLQQGTYLKNPAIDWSLLQLDSQRQMSEFFADLSQYFISQKAFAFYNSHANFENHTDFANKVISIERIDFQTGKKIYAVINLGHFDLTDYRFGVETSAQFKAVIDSDSNRYGGKNRNTGEWLAQSSELHGKSHSLQIPHLPPYGVIVLEQK
jgi:1,4-alpha-glucan branching enzyme